MHDFTKASQGVTVRLSGRVGRDRMTGNFHFVIDDEQTPEAKNLVAGILATNSYGIVRVSSKVVKAERLEIGDRCTFEVIPPSQMYYAHNLSLFNGNGKTESGPIVTTVKWFNREKGYGFLTLPDGTDVFIHISTVEAACYPLEAMRKGAEIVVDEIVEKPNGKKAVSRLHPLTVKAEVVPERSDPAQKSQPEGATLE